MAKGTISDTLIKGVAAGGIALASLGILSVGEYQLPSNSDAAQAGGSAEVVSASAAGAALTPGTYTAVAAGISSDITVTCTFDETGMTDMTVDVSGETPGLGADIGDEMISRVLDAQSNAVDGVAGSTITSDAIKTAVADCIAQASGSAPAALPSAYVPGTYTASAAGISSDITVTCTFDESGLTDMTADVSGETAGLGADIGDTMIEQFLAAKSTAVDGVAGCTITSDALKAAVADCIAQASADGAAEADEAEEISTEIETEIEGTTEITTEADDAAATEEEIPASGSYTPGTYTASAQGIESEVTATLTFDETSITDITVDVSGETAGLGAAIGEEMIGKFLSAQSADVDGVAGSTVTSDALKAAVADCIAQAEASEPAAEAEVSEPAEEAAPTAGAAFVPGTYTASAAGISSDVSVTCTFDETSMTAMEVNVSGETAGLGADIGDQMVEAFLNAQSADVDGISGCTITSDALKAAVADCFDQAAAEAEAPEAAETEAAEAELQTLEIKPGTYIASAKGISSDVTVSCIFDGSVISEVLIDVSGETAGIGDAIGDLMAKRILAAQSENVDGVAGATVTSDAIKAALADCIAQAEADGITLSGEAAEVSAAAEGTEYTASAKGLLSDVVVTATFDGEKLTSVSIDVSGETEGIGAAIGDLMAKRVLAAQSAEVDGVAGATVTSDAVKAAVADILAQTGAAAPAEAEEASTEAAEAPTGTEYTASAKGLLSDVTVTAMIDGEKITSVSIDVSGETEGIGAAIGDLMAKRILEAQSAEVDGVTGATVTSDAVKAAMADCIAQSK